MQLTLQWFRKNFIDKDKQEKGGGERERERLLKQMSQNIKTDES